MVKQVYITSNEEEKIFKSFLNKMFNVCWENKNIVQFGLKSESFHTGGSFLECISLLQKMNVSHAIEVYETGLNFLMMQLSVGQSMAVEDDVGREIKITRYKK